MGRGSSGNIRSSNLRQGQIFNLLADENFSKYIAFANSVDSAEDLQKLITRAGSVNSITAKNFSDLYLRDKNGNLTTPIQASRAFLKDVKNGFFHLKVKKVNGKTPYYVLPRTEGGYTLYGSDKKTNLGKISRSEFVQKFMLFIF